MLRLHVLANPVPWWPLNQLLRNIDRRHHNTAMGHINQDIQHTGNSPLQSLRDEIGEIGSSPQQ
jgi:hypothetical protein